MENSSDNNEPTENPKEESLTQDQYTQLKASLDRLSSELETVKENVQKRKRETTTLKILLYTGLLLLLVGFIYSNTTLQRVQLENLGTNFQAFQNQVNQDLDTVEKSLFNEFQQMKTGLGEMPSLKPGAQKLNEQETLLRDTVEQVKSALSQIEPARGETLRLIGEINQNTGDLLLAFTQYKKNAAGEGEKRGTAEATKPLKTAPPVEPPSEEPEEIEEAPSPGPPAPIQK